MFPGRDHVHTAVYRFCCEACAEEELSAAVALDHGFAGVIAIAVPPGTDPVEACAREIVGPELPVVAGFVQERVIMSQAAPPRPLTRARVCPGRSAGRLARTRRARAVAVAGGRVRRPVRPYHPRYRCVRRRPVGNREHEAVHPRADRHHRPQPRPVHAPHDRQLVPGRPSRTQHELFRRVGHGGVDGRVATGCEPLGARRLAGSGRQFRARARRARRARSVTGRMVGRRVGAASRRFRPDRRTRAVEPDDRRIHDGGHQGRGVRTRDRAGAGRWRPRRSSTRLPRPVNPRSRSSVCDVSARSGPSCRPIPKPS